MSPGERERIIERLIAQLSREAVRDEYDGYQSSAANRRQEVRALEDMRHIWSDWPDHLVGRQS